MANLLTALRLLLAVPALLLVFPIVGCQEPEPQDDMQENQTQSAMMDRDFYATDPAADSASADSSYAADDGFTTYPSDTTLAAATGGGATHVVAKGDTLFGLARQYYNDQRRWKDIYEANRDQVSDPDRISVGQQLVIP